MDNLLLAIQVTEPAAKLLKQSVEMHLQCCKSDEERKLLETLNIKLKGCLLEYRFHRHNWSRWYSSFCYNINIEVRWSLRLASTTQVGSNGKSHTYLFFKMSTMEVRALERAKEEFARARKQLEVARLRSTKYRGIDYEIKAPAVVSSVKDLTYRGVEYTAWTQTEVHHV